MFAASNEITSRIDGFVRPRALIGAGCDSARFSEAVESQCIRKGGRAPAQPPTEAPGESEPRVEAASFEK